MEQFYTTKQISKICSVTRKGLNYYQEKGLLIPAKIENNKALYSGANIATLQQILLLKKLHYSIDEIEIIMLSENWNPKYMFQNYQVYLKQRILDYQTMCESLQEVEQMYENNNFDNIMDRKNFIIFSKKKSVSSVIWKFWDDKNEFIKNKNQKDLLTSYMKKTFVMYKDYLENKIELVQLYDLYEEIEGILKQSFPHYFNPYIKNLGFWWTYEESYIKIQISLCGFTLGKNYYETFLRFWQNKLCSGGYEN
ncbi:MerR family transcriptional regulator [Spiroplasma alleghenense]|uniref:HTH merR-type domain-containing protein n=1 Tax=Spiroplasma alleghenense TaxID=216931 RepID=A0A345Z4S2_9MOLU|nr:MerR family transcriptional regulator [Spiroplasma alleghenense]AXK51601.1 hypothetical protein SALLE_v1c09310 [Spiroplasma alleghenense]